MSSTQKPSNLVPGMIVRAEVPDSAGRNPKLRPLVLLTGEEDIPGEKDATSEKDITDAAPLIGIAISSTLPKPLPDYYVLLPWDRYE